ncbi:MAG TPA: response regulator transcription factor [Acidimicrobiales bacterium]|nr:response regulator transcription factor [Acidimicrobiales bacterium]
MSSPELLIVEDDEVIGRSLCQTLQAAGYAVRWVRTGAEATASSGMRLVILDLGLPDIDGLDVCRRLRATEPDVEILILTARGSEIDVVVGLDAGADDYLAKPFRLAELLARVRARLRRERDDGERIRVGPITVDRGARQAFVSGDELDLRPKEFDLLWALAEDAGRVVRRERLMDDVWDEHWQGSTKTLDVHIAGLRRKLEDAGVGQSIATLRGIGYRLDVP